MDPPARDQHTQGPGKRSSGRYSGGSARPSGQSSVPTARQGRANHAGWEHGNYNNLVKDDPSAAGKMRTVNFGLPEGMSRDNGTLFMYRTVCGTQIRVGTASLGDFDDVAPWVKACAYSLYVDQVVAALQAGHAGPTPPDGLRLRTAVLARIKRALGKD